MRLSHLLAVGAALSLAVSAAPIPASALGIDKEIVVTGANSGGGFDATIDGFETLVWCVDDENEIHPGTASATYDGNVIALDDWAGGQNNLVRKGTETTWTDGLTLTALQRYQASAYLITQYVGGPISNANAYQEAVWRLTSTDGTAPAANTYYNDAVAFILDPLNANYGFGRWAVVSGVTSGGVISDTDTRQTFLVELEPNGEVPEPASMALIGGGLIGMALYTRRRQA